MKIIITLLALFMAASSVARENESVTKSDFAYGYSLEIDGDGAIYSLYLNEKIYQGMTREDRRDLRIFNSNGDVVPHLIRKTEHIIKKSVPTVSLPFFPLFKKDNSATLNTAASNIRITTNDQGSIIDLNYGKTEKKDQYLYAYLIDASALTVRPDQLELEWESDNPNFILDVELEGSDDLNMWHSVKLSSTLSDMMFKKHTLLQKNIRLPDKIPRYLRLKWSANVEFKLILLNAHFSDDFKSKTRHWSEFTPDKINKSKLTYYFSTKSVLPVDRFNVLLPIKNTLAHVLIETASSPTGPWYSRYSGLMYDLNIDDTRLTNSVIHQYVSSHHYWRVQILNSGGDFGGIPKLRLGWIPEQLLFVASGESPFTLTYGSARVGVMTAPLGQLLSESSILQKGNLIKSAKLGSAIDFGDPSRLLPPQPERDWKKFILWAVLIAGVLLLGFMAFRLFKQMDHADKNT